MNYYIQDMNHMTNDEKVIYLLTIVNTVISSFYNMYHLHNYCKRRNQ